MQKTLAKEWFSCPCELFQDSGWATDNFAMFLIKKMLMNNIALLNIIKNLGVVKWVSNLCMQEGRVGNVVYHTIIHFVKGHNKESRGLLYD